ncbi:MAG TPA: acyl-CoA dehydrogenase family protein, partial [Chloroflexota bacterium]
MTSAALGPLAEAQHLAGIFRQDAAERDLAAGTPKRERDLIRASGLLNLSVPTGLGGLGSPWPVLLRAVREIASADASLAHLFGYHHLGLVTPHLIGTPEQRDYWYAETARRGLFWGNCLNPLDPRTSLSRAEDESIRLNGEKSFCTGASDSDVMLVSATWPGESRLQVAVLPTGSEGIHVRDDWDNMGQRQTDSGSVSFRDVACRAADFLGPPGAGGSAWATLRPCVTQSILSNIFLGLAQGALAEARDFTGGLEKPFAVSAGA